MALNRRSFIVSGLATTGAALALPRETGAAARRVALGDPFRLGVASGDPRPHSVVLWTRLAPQPLEIGGGMGDRSVPVQWQLATDESFREVVASGTETATPGVGHSVHAVPEGLRPGAEFCHRFRAAGHLSPVGRTRTAPGTDPGSLTFAMASCQHFERGYYAAHHFIAADEPDLVIFLGDYMYEKPTDPANDPVRHYVQADEVNKLAEYRLRYAQTHHDRHLRAAHAVAPWLAVFDDHDVRVPFLVQRPAGQGGRIVNHQIVQNVDIYATLLDIANGDRPGPTGRNGRSLLPLIRGQQPGDWREAALIEHVRPDPGAPGFDPDQQAGGGAPSYHAVRTARELYVEYKSGFREYYDTNADPHQLRNDPRNPRVAELHRRLAALARCGTSDTSPDCWQAAQLG